MKSIFMKHRVLPVAGMGLQWISQIWGFLCNRIPAGGGSRPVWEPPGLEGLRLLLQGYGMILHTRLTSPVLADTPAGDSLACPARWKSRPRLREGPSGTEPRLLTVVTCLAEPPVRTSFPVPSFTTVSWAHLPDKLLVFKSWSPGLLLGNQNLNRHHVLDGQPR